MAQLLGSERGPRRQAQRRSSGRLTGQLLAGNHTTKRVQGDALPPVVHERGCVLKKMLREDVWLGRKAGERISLGWDPLTWRRWKARGK
jgi:hypothetical protein